MEDVNKELKLTGGEADSWMLYWNHTPHLTLTHINTYIQVHTFLHNTFSYVCATWLFFTQHFLHNKISYICLTFFTHNSQLYKHHIAFSCNTIHSFKYFNYYNSWKGKKMKKMAIWLASRVSENVFTRSIQYQSPWQQQVGWGQRTWWHQDGGLPGDQSDCLARGPRHNDQGNRWSLGEGEETQKVGEKCSLVCLIIRMPNRLNWAIISACAFVYRRLCPYCNALLV